MAVLWELQGVNQGLSIPGRRMAMSFCHWLIEQAVSMKSKLC